ncbi:kinase-like domain-containing protein [Rhizophagus clarus]|uniref:Kinase-like domain-containing protein n=1 Tax=Rhizophagus clarus TaxID=94130 RepID=A0A8H3MBF3_9GLOM|nr:kinase-like domain-containing protein [Rhizophagus clarus]
MKQQHIEVNERLTIQKEHNQAVVIENELNIDLYHDQPFAYTSINDVELDESLRLSDICINFPTAEITYTTDLSSNFMNDDDYDEGNYMKYGINLDTCEKLTDWINNLYLNDTVFLIITSFKFLSQLKFDTTSSHVDEIQSGIANFKEKLTIENWVWLKISIFSRNNIRSSEKFQQTIEDALESMKPLTHLQEVFDKYGIKYFIKKILFHLSNYSINCLLTQKEDINNITEENDLYKWIYNTNNDLEVIEFDNVILLYDILETKQKKIDKILNKQNNQLSLVLF